MSLKRYDFYYQQIINDTIYLNGNTKTVMQLPQVECIIFTISGNTPQRILGALGALEILGGQRAKITRASKSIASFHLREGSLVGTCLTIRGDSLFDLLDLLSTLILPRRNALPQFEGHINMGLDNILQFPQLQNKFLQFEALHGVQITIKVNKKKMQGQAVSPIL